MFWFPFKYRESFFVEFKFENFTEEDVLKIKIHDKDLLGGDELGRVDIPIRALSRSIGQVSRVMQRNQD